MCTSPRIGAAVLALALSALAGTAHAQTPPDAASAAAALANDGLDALGREDWLGAYDLYRAAWERLQDPSFAYNLAGICETVGRLPEALQWYETYLAVAPGAPDTADVQLAIAEVTAELERSWTRLRVTSAPPGATASVLRANSVTQLGPTPVEIWAEPGRVTVRLELEGYEALAEPIVLEAGATAAWAGALQAPGAAAVSTPEPEVVDEGGDQPPLPVSEAIEATVGQEEGHTGSALDHDPPRGAARGRRIGLLAGGGAALVGSGVAGWMAAQAAASYRDQIGTVNPADDALLGPSAIDARTADLQSSRDRARNAELSAWALGVSGVALTLAGVLMPRRDRDATTQAVELGPNQVTVRW